MERYFHEELKLLKCKLIEMGILAEQAIAKAIDALFERNSDLARQVILEEEKKINRLEIEIDEEGRKLFALFQPMACDLRTLATIFKINTDLERIGDHATNIAERAILLNAEPVIEEDLHLRDMAKITQQILRDALKAFITEDIGLARSIIDRDDEVDAYNDNLFARVGELIEELPSVTKPGMNLVMVGHNLERIADLANNIAEDVIYMKQGKEIRHHTAE